MTIPPMRTHLRRWGAVYILLGLWLGATLGQFYNQLDAVTQEAATHGEPFLWADFWPRFLASTFENWQSEFLQLAVQTFLIASYMKHRWFNADASADQVDLDRVEGKVDEIRDALGLANGTTTTRRLGDH